MSAKTSQLQIRISPDEKEALRRLADEAGMSVSAWVLARALPDRSAELRQAVTELRHAPDRRVALGGLLETLEALPGDDFEAAVEQLDVTSLPGLVQNLVAGAVEQEAARRQLPPPPWTDAVQPASAPWFASDLRSLRPHLMRVTPPAFKRRNVFMPVVRRARR